MDMYLGDFLLLFKKKFRTDTRDVCILKSIRRIFSSFFLNKMILGKLVKFFPGLSFYIKLYFIEVYKTKKSIQATFGLLLFSRTVGL